MGILLHAALHSADPTRAEQCRQADEADAQRAAENFRPAPRTFQARSGRRRVYFTPGDAAAYDRGYSTWPQVTNAPPGTPEFTGWADAEQHHDEDA